MKTYFHISIGPVSEENQRCMQSVREVAAMEGADYELYDDFEDFGRLNNMVTSDNFRMQICAANPDKIHVDWDIKLFEPLIMPESGVAYFAEKKPGHIQISMVCDNGSGTIQNCIDRKKETKKGWHVILQGIEYKAFNANSYKHF